MLRLETHLLMNNQFLYVSEASLASFWNDQCKWTSQQPQNHFYMDYNSFPLNLQFYHVPQESMDTGYCFYKSQHSSSGPNKKVDTEQQPCSDLDFISKNILSPDCSRSSTAASLEDVNSPCDFISEDEELKEKEISNKKNTRKQKGEPTPIDLEKYAFLIDLAVQHRNNWKRINKIVIETRNMKTNPQILRRIYEKLLSHKKTNRVKFSKEEDLIIIKCINEFGQDWNRIAYHLSNRTGTMVKNRYYSYIRKNGLVAKYTREMLSSVQGDEVETVQNIIPSKRIINILSPESNDLPIMNLTFQELNAVYPSDELHERVTFDCSRF